MIRLTGEGEGCEEHQSGGALREEEVIVEVGGRGEGIGSQEAEGELEYVALNAC